MSKDDTTVAAVSIAKLSVADLGAILRLGWTDLARTPLISVTIASVYTVGGWFLVALLFFYDLPYLVYPLAMGFALIAPFIAIAFYDVSRRLGEGKRPTFAALWAELIKATGRDVRWMALITAFAFFIWMDIAAMLTLGFFGANALDLQALLHEILYTNAGWIFLIVGHIAGAIIAGLVFSVSAVSFPMLYDRDVDVMTAMIASVRLVRRNPVVMGVWCLTIAALVGVALVSGLLLLPVVLPLLGYASWHLYRKAIVLGCPRSCVN